MLDFRHETFLTLCQIRSYTKTAQILHLTQPAISQHIKALEEYYGHRLFIYKDKQLLLTEHGEQLHKFITTVSADSEYMTTLLRRKNLKNHPINFGATLTIGEYVMPNILEALIKKEPDTPIRMIVDNTQHLLTKLDDGEIQFALIEGFFDKTVYHSELFVPEPFIAVCRPDSQFVGKELSFQDIIKSRLILREKGSGTREILEHQLQQHNLSINSFSNVTEIGNMAVIKKLVEDGLGITFLYKVAVVKEISEGRLSKLNINGNDIHREFNFVFLKNSIHTDEFLSWFKIFKELSV